MPLRIGSSSRIAAGVLAGLCAGLGAGVVMSAGAAPGDRHSEDYEIVRSTFSGAGDEEEGSALCSKGKLVMGGGGRVLDEGTRHYALVASDPVGPAGWSATFVRHPEANGSPIGPGNGASEDGRTDFEVTAVCAAVAR